MPGCICVMRCRRAAGVSGCRPDCGGRAGYGPRGYAGPGAACYRSGDRKADRPDSGSRSCRPPYDPSQADRGETGMRLLWWPDGEPGSAAAADRCAGPGSVAERHSEPALASNLHATFTLMIKSMVRAEPKVPAAGYLQIRPELRDIRCLSDAHHLTPQVSDH